MSEVAIRAILQGFDEAKAGLEQLSGSMDKTAQSAEKMNKAGSTSGKGLGEVAEGAKGAATELAGLSRFAAGAAGLLGGALVAAAVYAGKELYNSIGHVRTLGEQLNNMSQITGFSVEKLGGLQLAAATNNVSLEQLTHGITQFSRKLIDATKGQGESAEAFNRMGVSIRDSTGALKTTDELLGEVADKFKGYEDGAGKAALAQELFGRAGVQLIPLLNEGSAGLAKLREEAEKAGIVMSAETAEAANKLNSNLEVLKAYGQGFWVQVASPIVEGLAKITNAMRDARRAGDGFWGSLLEGARKATQMLFGVGDETQEMDVASSNISRLARERADALRRGDTNQVFAVDQQLEYWQERQQELFNVLTINDPVGGIGTAREAAPEKEAKQKKVRDTRERDAKRALREAQLLAQAQVDVEQMAAKDTEEAWKFYFQWKKRQEELEQKHAELTAKAEVTLNDMAAQDTAEAWRFYYQYREREERKVSAILGEETFQGIEVFKKFAGGVQSVVREILGGQINLSKQIKTIWSSLWDSVLDEFARVFTRAILKPIMRPFEEVFNELGEWIKTHVFDPVWEFIKTGFLKLVEWLRGLDWGSSFSGLTNAINGLLSQGGAVGNLISVLGSTLGGGFSGGVGGGGGGWEDTLVKAGMNWALEAIGSSFGLPGVGSVVGSVVSDIPIIGDIFDDFFATGTDMMVSEPTVFVAGEMGPERVTVSPVGAAHRGMGGGLSITVNGPMVGDYYTTQKFLRDLERWARG